MGLGGKVDDGVDVVLCEGVADALGTGHVPEHKVKVWSIADRREIVEGGAVVELVKAHDVVLGVGHTQMAHDPRSNCEKRHTTGVRLPRLQEGAHGTLTEPGPACYENVANTFPERILHGSDQERSSPNVDVDVDHPKRQKETNAPSEEGSPRSRCLNGKARGCLVVVCWSSPLFRASIAFAPVLAHMAASLSSPPPLSPPPPSLCLRC